MSFAEEIKKHTKPPTKVKKIDISEAEIVSDKTEDDNAINQKEIDDEYVKNLHDQKTIDLNEVGKKQAGERVTIDFMSEEHINSFTSSQSKKAADNTEQSTGNFANKTPEEIQSEIKKAEEDSKKNFTAKDFEDIASFIIFLIDTGMASALKWWSKDTSESAYSLPEKKKSMLSYQLSLILMKYQAKFSIEFMLLLTMVVVYIPACMLAKKRKKEIANPAVVYQPVKQAEASNNNAAENTVVENKVNEPVIPSPIIIKPNTGAKRPRGGQKKA